MNSDDALLSIEQPGLDDGVQMHRLAAESKVLDVNSRYAYLLWCRDFAATSVVARRGGDGRVVGFVTGYRRPDEPATLLVWQVAVAEEARGQGLAGRMLDTLFDQVAGRGYTDHLETTITPDNEASIALFSAFAQRREAEVDTVDLFGPELLGAEHLPEQRYRIGPVTATVRSTK
jgi:L-2,4-diaminobutyric acid acetyltransferase